MFMVFGLGGRVHDSQNQRLEDRMLLEPSSDCFLALALSLQLCGCLLARALGEQVEALRNSRKLDFGFAGLSPFQGSGGPLSFPASWEW